MPPSRHELDSIFVGLVRLGEAAGAVAALESRLAARDRDRAARFRLPDDRARFILGRGLLGALLRRHLGFAAGPPELALTEQGRPYLPAEPAVTFSITHARDLVGVALTAGARVGLDVESLDRRLELDALAERIFNAADLARFRALPAPDRARAFFRAWTGKEAVLKAKGVGLFGGVQGLSVPLDDARVMVYEEPPGNGTAWHLEPLPVPEGYLGAVAWDQPGRTIRLRTYASAELL